MNNNPDDARNKLKKTVANTGFFSLTLPAAFQRVFKKHPPSKESTGDGYNVSQEEECDGVPFDSAGDVCEVDDYQMQDLVASSSPNNLNTSAIIDNSDVGNCEQLGENGTINSTIGDLKNWSDPSVVSTEEPLKLNSTTIDGGETSNQLLAASSPVITSTTHPPESISSESISKLNCVAAEEEKASSLPPKSILKSFRNADSLDSSQYPSSQLKKSVSFNVTVLSEQYALPSLFYEERTNQLILRQYLKSCEKYKIKPLDKVVSQINGFSLKEEREVKIDLKGCRLDYKQCECLEEVFRYVRTQWLDISNTFLEDDGCISICEMCEYYDTATHICLSGNTRISNRGWLSVSQLIQKTVCLEYLDLSRTIFTEQMLQILVRAFRTVTSLKILHLEGCYLNGSRLQIIMSAISSNKNIRELYLAENKISTHDANCLFDLLVSNENVKVLDLRNNSLQDNGLLKLTQGLLQQTTVGVEVLHLWNNSITSNGIQGFVHVLSLHPSLHTLNLGRNKIGDEGILIIKFNLIKNKHLQRLGLSNNRITNTGAVALAELIADSTKLLRLDLRENNIGLAGLIALSQAMQVNYSVFKLDFNRNIKVEPEMADLVTRLVDDIRICCLRNRQLAKGGPLEEIISLTSVLSDDHSITESLKTIPPNELPSPQKSADGTMSSFWQIISKFTKAKTTTTSAPATSNTTASKCDTDASVDRSNSNSVISTTNSDSELKETEPSIIGFTTDLESETNESVILKETPYPYPAGAKEFRFSNSTTVEDCIKVPYVNDNIVQNTPNGCILFSDQNYLSPAEMPLGLGEEIRSSSPLQTPSSVNAAAAACSSLTNTSRFSNVNTGGGVGRFFITRVIEKYHYKPNYPIGTHCEDTSSTDKSYEIQQQDVLSGNPNENDDHSTVENIFIHPQQQLASTFIDDQSENQTSVDTFAKQPPDD